MKRLLYCVFSASGEGLPPALRGVDERPVGFVSGGGLSAAVSAVEDTPPAPTLDRVAAYERVVEAIFAARTVVPMRYGSILESEAAVAGFLKDQAATYKARLRALTGCVEMGVRVTPPRTAEPRESGAGRRPAAPRTASRGAGRAYLEDRAKRLPPDEWSGGWIGGLLERYRRALDGLFLRLESEGPAPWRLVVGKGGEVRLAAGDEIAGEQFPERQARRALSLSFLVPRAKVEAFRAAFAGIDQAQATSRLSGPWPPYSFVSP